MSCIANVLYVIINDAWYTALRSNVASRDRFCFRCRSCPALPYTTSISFFLFLSLSMMPYFYVYFFPSHCLLVWVCTHMYLDYLSFSTPILHVPNILGRLIGAVMWPSRVPQCFSPVVHYVSWWGRISAESSSNITTLSNAAHGFSPNSRHRPATVWRANCKKVFFFPFCGDIFPLPYWRTMNYWITLVCECCFWEFNSREKITRKNNKLNI